MSVCVLCGGNNQLTALHCVCARRAPDGPGDPGEPQPQDDVHDDVSRIGFLLIELSAADRALVRALVERLAAGR